MRVIVTGGAGFVGSAIVRALIVRGHSVLVVDDYSTGKPANLEGVKCDIHGVDAAEADYSSADAIVHAAAYPDVKSNWRSPEDRANQWKRNAELTFRVLERTPVKTRPVLFVLLSTCSVYGPGTVDETSPTRATSPYAATKLAAEAMVSAYTEAKRVRGVVLRLVNVVGPRYAHGHLADFVTMAQKQGRIHALDDGVKRKSFVHVEDVADAAVMVMEWAPAVSGSVRGLRNITSEVQWSWSDSVAVMRAMRPERTFELTWEERSSGWVGDPEELAVRTFPGLYGKRSIVKGVAEALTDLGW